ncbi:MAG: sigma-70 family RNA polymerase sigma factor [Planctomycetes bacterium]|nr:sigma-70 family RNA polymerase sigma factor [Planctomycetota bacterium]
MTDAAFRPEELASHAEFVRRLARSLLADPNTADDVAQDTVRAALEARPRGDALRAWLATVARNFARRARRGEARRRSREEFVAREEAHGAVDAALEREETMRRVVAAVGSSPEHYRAVLILRFYDDLPPREIARRLGVPVETVRTRQRRAADLLRVELSRDGADWRSALFVCASLAPAKSTLAWSVAFCGLVLVSVGVWFVRADASDRLVRAHADSAPDSPLLASMAAEQRFSASADGADELRGRVVDEAGSAVANFPIHVLASVDPFAETNPAPKVASEDLVGRAFTTGADGSWSAEDCGTEPVLVRLGHVTEFEPASPQGRERSVIAPAAEVDFVVRRVPTATVIVRVIDGRSRRALERFGVSVHGDRGAGCEHSAEGPNRYDLGFYSARAEAGVVRLTVRVRPGEAGSFHVALRDELAPDQQIVLRVGETTEVVFVRPDGERVFGQVVDRDGNAIEDALVFFGDRTTGRGDEAFRPFDAKRIVDGARTAADGWFELEARGPTISAWHAAYSQTTVERDACGRIVLGPLGSIRGRLVDASGAAQPGVSVNLDDVRGDVGALTDERGAFAFEGVDAGAHGLFVARELDTVVRLEAGEELDIVLARNPGTTTLAFAEHGEPRVVDELEGLLIGWDRVSNLAELKVDSRSAGARSELTLEKRLRFGRYIFVCDRGWTGSTEISGERAIVELGSTAFTVRSESPRRIQVVPAGSDEFVRLVAARCPVRVGKRGSASFLVRPGRWTVVEDRGRALAEIAVPPQGVALELR